MAYKYEKMDEERGYILFWFTNSKSGRRISFVIADHMVKDVQKDMDSFCRLIEYIIASVEKEGYYDQG